MIRFSLQKKLQSAGGTMLFDIKHAIAPHSFVGIYGASGAGKTSLLRMLAGFLEPDEGFIHVHNIDWYDKQKRINVAPQKRKTGFVFQDYALFPNMTVRENLAFALDKSSDKSIVEELLLLVELDQLQHRKIQTLSGGQQQRVALARALVRKPDMLLLDEPLSALDSMLRDKMQQLILQLHKKFRLTTILVSHDMQEMIRLADEIIFLKDGRIDKKGSPVTTLPLQHAGEQLILQGIVAAQDTKDLYVLAGKDLFTLPCTPDMKGLEKGDAVAIIIESKNMQVKKYL